MTDPHEVAAKLTRAQREAMCSHYQGPFSTSIHALTAASCRAALQRKGLVVDRMYSIALTPLGLAVRAILQEKQ